MMKRRFLTLAVCCILAIATVLPTTVFAESMTSYNVSELTIAISLPENYIVFTRDILANDSSFSAVGLDSNTLMTIMLAQRMYLDAIDENMRSEITITSLEVPLENFDTIDNELLNSIIPLFTAAFAESGITVTGTEIYHAEATKYIRISYIIPDGDSSMYGIQYTTVNNDQAIYVAYRSYTGEPTLQETLLLQDIIDSIILNA